MLFHGNNKHILSWVDFELFVRLFMPHAMPKSVVIQMLKSKHLMMENKIID